MVYDGFSLNKAMKKHLDLFQSKIDLHVLVLNAMPPLIIPNKSENEEKPRLTTGPVAQSRTAPSPFAASLHASNSPWFRSHIIGITNWGSASPERQMITCSWPYPPVRDPDSGSSQNLPCLIQCGNKIAEVKSIGFKICLCSVVTYIFNQLNNWECLTHLLHLIVTPIWKWKYISGWPINKLAKLADAITISKSEILIHWPTDPLTHWLTGVGARRCYRI